MKTRYALLLFIITLSCGSVYSRFVAMSASAQIADTQNTPDQILKRFVEECVSITPGSGEFPKSFTTGGLNAGPLPLPPKVVEMKSDFRISKFEVTQELYQAVMGNNPSRWKGDRNSVEMVSFQDAEQFCDRLTVMLQAKKLLDDGQKVRLPTEAEWEYCCRAGTKTLYSFGDDATTASDQENQATVLSEYAWHTGNAAGNDPVVGSLKPNPWGLYDMHGYLWEFVADPQTTAPDASDSAPDPAAKDTKDHNAVTKSNKDADATTNVARIIRGGSWRDHHSLLTSSFRQTHPAKGMTDAIGFRCVISKSP